MQSWRSVSNEQRTSWACPWRRSTLLRLHGSTLTLLRCCRHVLPFYEQHWTTGSNTRADIAIYLYLFSPVLTFSSINPCIKNKKNDGVDVWHKWIPEWTADRIWQGQIRQETNAYESLVTSSLFFYFAFLQRLIRRNTVGKTKIHSDISVSSRIQWHWCGSMASTCFNSLSCTLEALNHSKKSKEKISGKPHNCWISL